MILGGSVEQVGVNMLNTQVVLKEGVVVVDKR